MLLARALEPGMLERGAGHLVFISSLSGKSATPLSSVYNATKFGLRGFALGLRADLDPLGIGVSLVSPASIRDAGMFADSGADAARASAPARPQQVANAVVQGDRAEPGGGHGGAAPAADRSPTSRLASPASRSDRQRRRRPEGGGRSRRRAEGQEVDDNDLGGTP